MPYRKKTAWLSLLAMVLTFGPYFGLTALRALPAEALPDLRQLGWFAVAAVVQVILLGFGRLYLRRESGDEAGMPLDERDRAIALRAVQIAYYVLMLGMILVGCVMPFNAGGWKLINAAVLMIVLAEVVHYGVVVASYRRQA